MSLSPENPRYLVLLALAEGNKNGADIQRQIIGDTIGYYLPTNTMYRSLHGLKEIGLVELVIWEGQKVYQLTDSGKNFLERAAREKQETSRLAQQRLGFR